MCKECEEHRHFICECGREFDKIRQMTGHQSNCKVHQKFLEEEREKRRLPNGLFKCENPGCPNEHDGSYGSGRFCSEHCRRSYTGKSSVQTMMNNGTFHSWFVEHQKQINHTKSPYGTWKCDVCGEILETRRKKYEHMKNFHPTHPRGRAWNKGLTKETCSSIAKAVPKIVKALKRAYEEGRITGHASTPEKELFRRKRMSISALNRTTPSVCKRTEPYTKKDGSIVNLDSSYERTIAKLLDEHDVDWIRPKPLDWYSHDGVKHHYFPDFYLTEHNLYLDPKNDYCFKAQAEKISYIREHYDNCIFMTKDQLTWDFLKTILDR